MRRGDGTDPPSIHPPRWILPRWLGRGGGCFPISWIEFNRVLSSHIRRSGIPTVLLLLLLSFHPSVISWHFNSGRRGWISERIELHYRYIDIYISIYIIFFLSIIFWNMAQMIYQFFFHRAFFLLTTDSDSGKCYSIQRFPFGVF